jgi:hypothetical protein
MRGIWQQTTVVAEATTQVTALGKYHTRQPAREVYHGQGLQAPDQKLFRTFFHLIRRLLLPAQWAA